MRPRFKLTDEQARVIRDGLPTLLERHPYDPRSNRPFVAAFVRLVYDATGELFGPTIYRRLLDAYAADRKPSNDTLAQEKAQLQNALRIEQGGAVPIDRPADDERSAPGVDIGKAIDEAFKRHVHLFAGAAIDRQLKERIAYLEQQLVTSGQRADAARAQAARLAADLQAASTAQAVLHAQVDAANALLLQFGTAIDATTVELAGMRSFALNAVDGVRGETRAWQHQCNVLERKLKEAKEFMEVFRRAAYERGAPIPKGLLEGRG